MRGRSLSEQVREAAEVLGVLGDLALVLKGGSPSEVKAAFGEFIVRAEARHRDLVLECHPDRPGGGDLGRMQRINAARDLLRKVELDLRRRPSPQMVSPWHGMRVTVVYSSGLHGVSGGFGVGDTTTTQSGSAFWGCGQWGTWGGSKGDS